MGVCQTLTVGSSCSEFALQKSYAVSVQGSAPAAAGRWKSLSPNLLKKATPKKVAFSAFGTPDANIFPGKGQASPEPSFSCPQRRGITPYLQLIGE